MAYVSALTCILNVPRMPPMWMALSPDCSLLGRGELFGGWIESEVIGEGAGGLPLKENLGSTASCL